MCGNSSFYNLTIFFLSICIFPTIYTNGFSLQLMEYSHATKPSSHLLVGIGSGETQVDKQILHLGSINKKYFSENNATMNQQSCIFTRTLV